MKILRKNKYNIRGQRTQSPLVRERHPKTEINKSQTGGIFLFFFFFSLFFLFGEEFGRDAVKAAVG